MSEFSQDQLARAIAPLLEVPPATLTFSRSSTGRFNETWFVEGAGRPLVGRIAPLDDRSRMLFYEHRMMWQEPGVHGIVRERTGCPVPEILAMKKADPVLDWDRALWGDPEIEFAVLDYCGISTPAFWEGYGQPRNTDPGAAIRRVFYLLYEIQKYIVIRRARDCNPAAADRYRRQALSLAESIEKHSVE